jgi:hypothetical protein
MRRLLVAGLILIVLVLGGIALARLTSKPIDGIGCDVAEGATYHVHAHLAIVVGEKAVAGPPANTGIHIEHLCLYWLHTHDTSGIIHIEAPHRISPTLGNFFDIWGQPLSRQRVADHVVGAGQALQVYVGPTLYSGNPRSIPLYEHTKVTLEIGPPFIDPPSVNWQGL